MTNNIEWGNSNINNTIGSMKGLTSLAINLRLRYYYIHNKKLIGSLHKINNTTKMPIRYSKHSFF